MRNDCIITSWRAWDRDLDRCVRDFHQEHGVFPTIMVANRVTLRRLNVAANGEHVRGKNGRVPRKYVEIKGFAASGYSLLFAEEADLNDNEFSLIKVEEKDSNLS